MLTKVESASSRLARQINCRVQLHTVGQHPARQYPQDRGGEDAAVPPTIEDPTALDELSVVLGG
jgi:hypothetical protein